MQMVLQENYKLQACQKRSYASSRNLAFAFFDMSVHYTFCNCVIQYNRPPVRPDGAARDLDAGPARAHHRVGRARVWRWRAARGLQDRGEGRAPADVDGGRQGQVGRPEAQSARPRGKI